METTDARRKETARTAGMGERRRERSGVDTGGRTDEAGRGHLGRLVLGGLRPKIDGFESAMACPLDVDGHISADIAPARIGMVHGRITTTEQTGSSLAASYTVDELDEMFLRGQISTLRSFANTTTRRFSLQARIYTRRL